MLKRMTLKMITCEAINYGIAVYKGDRSSKLDIFLKLKNVDIEEILYQMVKKFGKDKIIESVKEQHEIINFKINQLTSASSGAAIKPPPTDA